MSGFTQFTVKTGKGTVKLKVDANTASCQTRSGNVAVGGSEGNLLITQAGKACTVTLSPTTSPLISKASGGPYTFMVTASPADCSWSAASAATWAHTSSSGTGTGTVSYTVDANSGKAARNGKINVTYTGGKTPKAFTVKQGNK